MIEDVRAIQADLRSTPWSRSLRAAAPVAAAGYAGWIAITLALRLSGVTGPGGGAPSWRQFDALWYERIASSGYLGAGGEPGQSTAFFPLYPLLIGGLDPLLPGGASVAAVTVSAAAYVAALTVLHRLAVHEFDPRVARRALVLLAAFPTAFFLGVGYNMSLALLLIISAVYALRREQWWAAGALGGLATATRSSALVLLVAFGFEYVRRTGWRPRPHLLAAALIPAGMAGHAVYLWHAYGDPLAFGHAQKVWGRAPDWPWAGILRALGRAFAADTGFGQRFHNLVDVTVVLTVLVVLLVGLAARGVLRPDQRFLVVIGLALWLLVVSVPTSNPTLPVIAASSRYSLEIFPIFLIGGRLLLDPRSARLLVLGLCGMLQAALCTLFVLGIWAG